MPMIPDEFQFPSITKLLVYIKG